mmetsp:Transcript_9822/g.19346  ORF Transcript_9822/g.19346 Transcript_9822/m.19346 type:complete len:110 (-) Transcript_9822:187-516(-)
MSPATVNPSQGKKGMMLFVDLTLFFGCVTRKMTKHRTRQVATSMQKAEKGVTSDVDRGPSSPANLKTTTNNNTKQHNIQHTTHTTHTTHTCRAQHTTTQHNNPTKELRN